MNIEYLKGLIEGEGCFSVISSKNKREKIQYQAQFRITLHESEKKLLNAVQSFLGFGEIYKVKSNKKNNVGIPSNRSLTFCVSSITNCSKLIEILGKTPFIGNKQESYSDWTTIVDMINNDIHKTKDGQKLIKEIRRRFSYPKKGRKIKNR